MFKNNCHERMLKIYKYSIELLLIVPQYFELTLDGHQLLFL